jgi:hypothetical protein
MGKIARFLEYLDPRRRVSLVRTRRPEDLYLTRSQRRAAADVKRIEEDDTYFGRRARADEEELG